MKITKDRLDCIKYIIKELENELINIKFDIVTDDVKNNIIETTKNILKKYNFKEDDYLIINCSCDNFYKDCINLKINFNEIDTIETTFFLKPLKYMNNLENK